ncbi:helix-turn-helix domain-containing protein [Martelella radicis]|uniref:Transcriptional regulator with XRE-family HTH domain n=1 Tax=Martelella radicis TaxID=1397476 RepID=A0A7W6KG14_9HYPH|nr:helix-turn-helix transcriptional regulator [Martelella radicis]MBB4120405.1 transcriptional regulator with XRE-family HTH domain [Martelella radicis]
MMEEELYGDDTLGGRLLAARERAGLSLADLAGRLGVTRETVRNWECDRSEPSLERLVRIAGHLNVRPLWLISGDEEKLRSTSRQIGLNLKDVVIEVNHVGHAGRYPDAITRPRRPGPFGFTVTGGRTLH